MELNEKDEKDENPHPHAGMPYSWYQAIYGSAIAQLLLGIICTGLGIAVLVNYEDLPRTNGAVEVWTPIFFIVAGIAGIYGSRRDSDRVIMAHMILSMIAWLVATGLCIDGCFYARQSKIHIAIIVFSILEFLATIVSTCLCCQAICCV